jgi:membrane fusion protein (multidrug efflux system)
MKITSSMYLGLALSLFLILLSGCEHAEHSGHGDIQKLEVTNPLRKNLGIAKEYVAQIHAIRRIEIRAMERGFIEKIFIDEGQLVRQGQPMFKLMQNHFTAELDKATAEANALRIEYENTKALADKNIVSPNELALAKANLDKATADVTMAKTHLAWTEINAPFDGFVDRLEVRNGSLVEENESLTTLSDTSNMWVYFNLPEAEYLDYVSGKTKQSAIKVKLKMANGEIYDHSGVIETIVADFDNKTGNIEFRATFPNPDNILRHGQTGNVLMSTPYLNAIVIPQKATYEILDKTYVYVVNGNGELEQRLITVAAELPHVYIVKDGLDEHDKVLLEGLRKVHKGQKIEPKFRAPQQVIAGLNLYAE